MGSVTKAYPSTKKCGYCGGELKKYERFYDAKIMHPRAGRVIWCWLCQSCFERSAIGLGDGIGQEYNSKTDEKLRG